MRRRFWHQAFCGCLATALLQGCGSLQTVPQPTVAPQGARAKHAPGSWMSYEATTSDLLYITNYSNVLVFTYPQGKLVGTLKGFYSAVGECVDGHGDVFITNFKPVTVYEYAHGGKKPIAEFPTKKAGTVGCAINPVNGDLAITGQTSYVEIFKGAKGSLIIMRDKGMQFGQFCPTTKRRPFSSTALPMEIRKQIV